jgi:hypothetical protein
LFKTSALEIDMHRCPQDLFFFIVFQIFTPLSDACSAVICVLKCNFENYLKLLVLVVLTSVSQKRPSTFLIGYFFSARVVISWCRQNHG